MSVHVCVLYMMAFNQSLFLFLQSALVFAPDVTVVIVRQCHQQHIRFDAGFGPAHNTKQIDSHRSCKPKRSNFFQCWVDFQTWQAVVSFSREQQ